MADSSIVLTQLDFDSHKSSLKEYLRAQEEFRDYDFEGSNMSTLLDILSYNTYLNSFYLNMIGNEGFLDSAKLRDSVVSHAKELNYLPRSFNSAIAKLDITIGTADSSKRSLVIPKGTAFLSRVDDNTFSFLTNENIILTNINNQFSTTLTVYEGSYLSDTYAIDYNSPLRYKINNNTIDLSSLTVTIIEDNGSIQTKYTRATSLLGLDETKEVFFLQPTNNGAYEILFGDGIIAKKPKNNSIVLLEYRICAGELPNGAQKFIPSGKIDGESAITISTNTAAGFGSVSETLESIKFNAPRAFTTQERAITAEDYENILRQNFPEINAVSAYGGEDATPPQYGRIFISVDLSDVDDLPVNKKNEYIRFLKSRSSVAMEPTFINPDYTYLDIKSTVRYNVNRTGLNPEDIRTLVASAILSYTSGSLNNFNRTLRYSKMINSIDSAEDAIVSNDTTVRLIKLITPKLNTPQSFKIDFKVPLVDSMSFVDVEHPSTDQTVITSTAFTYGGLKNCLLEDDGDGILRIISQELNTHTAILNVGSVNYATGVVTINDLNISSINGSTPPNRWAYAKAAISFAGERNACILFL